FSFRFSLGRIFYTSFIKEAVWQKMMKLQTYAGVSFVSALAVIYHAFNSRGQFYPAMVYLSTSKISLVLLLNMGFVIMCILWQLAKLVFLGSLREAEVERLNEQAWREVMEILFAITIFRQDFSVSFLAMVTALFFIKALHWMCQKRVEYIETTPSVPMLSHIRIISFMSFLLALDGVFLYSSLKYLIQTWQPSVSLFFAFENYGVPLHLIRELYETFRNFKVRVADYIRSDATCIICREEMVTAKKLICGHFFHVHCLRSWLERQHTCPTCRALVVPSENGTAAAVGQHGVRFEAHPQGAGASTSTQSAANGAANDILSQHQARIQAAAAAASIYEKSYVYPSADTFTWSQGYAFLPPLDKSLPDSGNVEFSAESTSSGQIQQQQFTVMGGQTNFAFPQVPYHSTQFQTSGTNLADGERSGDDLNRMEAQERLLRSQIEVLRNQLQFLQQKRCGSMNVSRATSDNKEKTTASSSSSVSDCGRHAEGEEVNKV
ncbi:hypothetical protein IFM89_024933, partial [Coptis chinensis]